MNKKIIWGIAGIVVLVAAFYGGVFYEKGQVPASTAGGGTYGTYSGSGSARAGRTGGFGGLTVGQIIAKDATSITVQLANTGTAATSTTPIGSKIIYLDSSTPITKQVNGTMADLAVGTSVSVSGTANTDGSITATAVQIRPANLTK